MHQVNEIYQELAGMVDGQQDQIDKLEDDIRYSRGNVEAAKSEVECMSYKDSFCGALESFDFGRGDCEPFPEFDKSVALDESKTMDSSSWSKNSPTSVLPEATITWLKPFQTFGEDLHAVTEDIIDLGKDVIAKGKQYDCNSSK